MKIFVLFIATLFVLQVQHAYGKCAEINRNSKVAYVRLVAAKNLYKEEVTRIQSRPFTVDSLSQMIASNEKMIRAMDEVIVHLERARVEGCFGKKAAEWTRAIALFRTQRNDLSESTEEYKGARQIMLKEQDGATFKGMRREVSGACEHAYHVSGFTMSKRS